MHERKSVVIVTAVWGDWHVKQFLEVNLACLLAKSNLPELSRLHDVQYIIFTRRRDAPILKSSEFVRRLEDLCPLNLKYLGDEETKWPIEAHHKAWRIATDLAVRAGAYVLYMPPDVAWSENAFSTIARRLQEGFKAVFVTFLRVVESTFVDAIAQFRDRDSGVIAMPGRKLMALASRHLNPLMAAYSRHSPHFPVHSEMIVWAVPGEGMVLRILARELFLFDPRSVERNENVLISDPSVIDKLDLIDDSDDLLGISLAEADKDSRWYLNSGAFDPIPVAQWWLRYDSPANDAIVSRKIRWYWRHEDRRAWQSAELASDLVIRRIAAAREGLRIWIAAHELEGCDLVASRLGLAIMTGQIAHAVRGSGAAYVFLPQDDRLKDTAANDLWAGLDEADRRAFGAMARAHYGRSQHSDYNLAPLEALVARDEHRLDLTMADGSIRTVRREKGVLTIDDCVIATPSVAAGANRVYRIEGMLRSLV